MLRFRHASVDKPHSGFRVKCLGSRVWGLGFRVWGLGFCVLSLGCWP